jgi:hypothetical protein
MHISYFAKYLLCDSDQLFYCLTVPDAPRDIKVLASGPMALLVSWLAPSTPRGSLTGYTLHSRVLLPGSQQAPPELQPPPRALPPAATSFELPGLRAGAEYHFWVTAATRVGEGPATRVVAALPTIRGEISRHLKAVYELSLIIR